MIYHSQPEVKNDQWIIEIALPNKHNGYFIEAGAYDGIEMSNTFTLEKYFNWKGICIEPNRDLFKRLVQNRTCICENVGLYHSVRNVEFIDTDRGIGGIKDTIRHKKSTKSYPVINLKCDTLYQVLTRNQAPPIIDYLSLDTEGSEYDILKNFPFHLYSFRCITVEMPECEDLLLSKGYLVVQNPYNTENDWERYYRHPYL